MIRSRLFRNTLIFIIILFGFVANVTALYSAWILYHRLTDEYESKAVAIARSVAQSELDIIVRNDAASIQSRIDQYLDLEGVSFVLVTDSAGEVLAHTFIPVIPQTVLDLIDDSVGPVLMEAQRVQNITLTQGDVLYVRVPVLAGAGGFVHIGMDRSIITGYILAAVVRQHGLTMVFFIVSVVVAYLFMRSISRPLSDLTDYANKVAAHDFSGSISITTKDEIGVLASAMQSMSRDLATLINHLEAAVAEKTGELQETVAYVSAIISNIADGLLVVDAEGHVARTNAALDAIFGCEVGRLEGLTLEDAFTSGTWGGEGNRSLVTLLRQAAREGRNQPVRSYEIFGCRCDGEMFPLEVSMVCFEREGVFSIICLMRDNTERKRAEESMQKAHDLLERKVAERTRELSRMNSQLMLENAERRVVEQALRRTEERYRSIFENAIEGIFQTTPEGRCINANPALARILGFDAPEQLISGISDVARDVYLNPEDRIRFVEEMSSHGRVVNFEFRARRRSGEVIWVVANARKVTDKDGRTLYFEGFLEDMTMRKEAQERLEHQAFHDPLTGLPNRLLFQDHLRMALSRHQRRTQYYFAVLYLDLDRFKIINDSLGHAIGDELLCYVAGKLRECVREVDTVARFGGDEFAILLEEISAPREAVRIARRIQEMLGSPVDLDGHEVFTSASIGIVLKTSAYAHPQEVLRDADTAMYRAKELGKSRFKVFNQRMHEEALRLMALETELRRAVERRELEVWYQPIVDTSLRRICGFEALVRWHHESMGAVPPSEFIALAEDSGLITEIGEFVLEEAVRNIKRWNRREQKAHHGNLFVSVNISGRQFMQPDFAGYVEQHIRNWNVNPDLLRFEITESMLMDHGSMAVDTISRLRELGMHMCIDDFGTGYSSLSYLQRLPVDTIKIDRSFVAELGDDKEGRSIVRSILSLGYSLGLDVVAEGVETPAQAQLLGEFGCRFLQGFLYAPALPAAEVDTLLSLENPLAYLAMSYEKGDFPNVSGL